MDYGNIFIHVSNDSISIPGKLVSESEKSYYQSRICELLNLKGYRFPGSQPVSLNRHHLSHELLDKDFYVCEKTDGVRALLYVSPQQKSPDADVILITRANEFFKVSNITFGSHENLIDGEIVVDKEGLTKYFAFDCMAQKGKVIINQNLIERRNHLTKIYEEYMEHKINFNMNTAPFKFYFKEMAPSYKMEAVLKHIGSKDFKHVSDGLIFTAVNAPYTIGTDKNILKWKPPHLNTVDFVLDLEFQQVNDEKRKIKYKDYDSKPRGHLFIGLGSNNITEVGLLPFTTGEWEKLKSLQEPLVDRIVECACENKQWKFLRLREDKETPNHVSVYNSVLESIFDNINAQKLLAIVPSITYNWKQVRHHFDNVFQQMKPKKRAGESLEALEPRASRHKSEDRN